MGVRQEKLADQIRDVLAQCFTAERLNDVRLHFVTITHVALTPDLQQATIYYRLINCETEDPQVTAALDRSRTHLRTVLGREIQIRRLPELRFVYDKSVEYGSRIEELLRKV